MDPERLIGELVGGFLGGRKTRRKGGLGLGIDVLTGGSSRGGYAKKSGGLINAGTLLTVGGLIWGALETMQHQGGMPTASPAPPTGPVPPGPPRSVMSTPSPAPSATPGGGGVVVPPPLPPIPGATPVTSGPPVAVGDTPVPATLLPLVQLAVSAARADGEMSEEEVAAVRRRAESLGAQSLVDAELAARRPLESIAAAFVSEEQRQVAYALAYAIVHGQDAVSSGERMYLTQLQRLLKLDHDTVAQIERDTLSGS